MTKNERDKLIELLKRFSNEYCCDDMPEYEINEDYCNNCLLCNKCCCDIVMYLSDYLGGEIDIDEMMKNINREYNARKE